MAEETKEPGQTAYEVYSARMDGRNEAGLPLAQWADLWIGWKEAWMSVESACQRLPTPPEIEEPPAAAGDTASPSSGAPVASASASTGPGHSASSSSGSGSGTSRRP